MSKLSRTKGATYERELAKRWRESKLWPEARRGIGQARAGGEVCDVEGGPFWVEAKRRKRHDIRGALVQAEQATDGRVPVVVARYDGDPETGAIVAMRIGAFEELVKRAGLDGVWERVEPYPPRDPDEVADMTRRLDAALHDEVST